MSEPITNPLAYVRQDLWRETDRNPPDDAAVAHMIIEAVNTLSDPLIDGAKQSPLLTARLVKGLDPHERGGLGVEGVVQLEAIAQLAEDPAASRVQQWGALSLLGLLAMTYNSEPLSDFSELGLAQDRAQLASTIARTALSRLANDASVLQDRRSLAVAFLSRSGVPTEDVAIELMSLLPDEPEESVIHSAFDDSLDEPEAVDAGSRIGEPERCMLVALSREAERVLAGMDWARRPDLDITRGESLVMRSVYHDGVEIAKVVDLTVCSTPLEKMAVEVMTSDLADRFWGLLTTSVVNLVAHARGELLDGRKVLTYSFGNAQVPNASLVRGYYVPLGTQLNGVRLFGLIGACRTKDKQRMVLNIIGGRKTTRHHL